MAAQVFGRGGTKAVIYGLDDAHEATPELGRVDFKIPQITQKFDLRVQR